MFHIVKVIVNKKKQYMLPQGHLSFVYVAEVKFFLV